MLLRIEEIIYRKLINELSKVKNNCLSRTQKNTKILFI